MANEVTGLTVAAAALIMQFFYVLIMSVGVWLLADSGLNRRTDSSNIHWPIVILLTLLSLGPMIMSSDITNVSQALLGGRNVGVFSTGNALLVMFVSDCLLTLFIIAGTGGSRDSAFTSAYLMLPAMAILLREPLGHTLTYLTIVCVGSAVTSARQARPASDPDEGSGAFLFVLLASTALTTWVAYVTTPR